MAEGFAKKENIKRNLDFQISSAGINAEIGKAPSDNAIYAMKKQSIDISGYKSKQLTEKMISDSDFILTMTESQCLFLKSYYPNFAKKIFCLSDKDVSDPYGQNEKIYIECSEEIKKAVKAVFDKLGNDNQNR